MWVQAQKKKLVMIITDSLTFTVLINISVIRSINDKLLITMKG